jgi:oligoribonuclease
MKNNLNYKIKKVILQPIYFLLVDCEMTGLIPEIDHILEIAGIITDDKMNTLADFHFIIKHPQSILNTMDIVCQEMHDNNELLSLVLSSNYSYQMVENHLTSLLNRYAEFKNTYIAGNSIYTDLNFIKKHMPKVAEFLHYRILDISSLKIMAALKKIPPFEKKNQHSAKEDILESIAEYHYYQNFLFK